ncbi:glycosyltransferase [Bacillus tianshenii]|nr:glycosyltransferase [Bacillus tianshenii]
MRILYVTPLWSGFRDLIVEGNSESKGMPAFIKPLQGLIQAGHQVDFFIGITESHLNLNIQVEWLIKSDFYLHPLKLKGFERGTNSSKILSQLIKVMKQKKYDFVYCHGSFGTFGNIAANMMRIPCGLRLYGTFFAERLEKQGKFKVMLKHPLESLAYRLNKEFLLITNDGTRGDYVRKMMNPKPNYNFYFWLNGVDKAVIHKQMEEKQFRLPDKVLFFPARIARWKQQHKAIELLKRVHEHGNDDVYLHFAGHIKEEAYWEELQEKVRKLGLDKYVQYVGTLNQRQLNYYYRNSLAVLSFYRLSNLGNVLIEALTNGGVILTLNDHSTDNVLKNGKNGFLVNNMDEGQQVIAELIQNEKLVHSLKSEASLTSKEVFLAWGERIQKEITIIENAVN